MGLGAKPQAVLEHDDAKQQLIGFNWNAKKYLSTKIGL